MKEGKIPPLSVRIFFAVIQRGGEAHCLTYFPEWCDTIEIPYTEQLSTPSPSSPSRITWEMLFQALVSLKWASLKFVALLEPV